MISSHLAYNGADLDVHRLDEAGKAYSIRGFNTQSNPVCVSMARSCVPQTEAILTFQSGDLADVGRNGLSVQALLAVIADHLSKSSSRRETAARQFVEDALAALVQQSKDEDPEQVPCPCKPNDKKCSAPLPAGSSLKIVRS